MAGAPWHGSGWVLAATCLGTFMAILDTSLVNLGLHAIAADLHVGMATLQWVIDLYNLVYATFILTGGALGDLFGRRRIFVIGAAVFGAGSLMCALAPNAPTLILGRGVAGLGAALELPAALAILNMTYPDPDARARAIAVWGGMNGLAMAIGPTLGGVLVDALGWRSLFWLILPVAAAAVGLAALRVPETRDPSRQSIDLPGQGLAILVLATLSLGFIEGPGLGWGSPWIVACFVVCLIGAGAFLDVERRARAPLIPLSVFRSRPFSAAILTATLMTFGMYGMLFVLPLFFQAIRGDTALTAGLALLPMSVTFFVVSPLAGRVATRVGPRRLIGGGMTVVSAGCAGLAWLTPQSNYALAGGSLLAVGIGLGLITGPIATVAMANAPAERSGIASGLVNMGRLIGATLGVAVLGLLFGAEAGHATANAADFMQGMHATFVLAAAAELGGALIAILWLRRESLGSARFTAAQARRHPLLPSVATDRAGRPRTSVR